MSLSRNSMVSLQLLLRTVFLVLLISDSIPFGVLSSPLPQPSSAWNQPALAINTINSGNDSNKGKGNSAISGPSPASTSSTTSNNNNNNNGNEFKKKKYSWNTIMHYGVAGGSDHNIRHKAKKLRDHSKLPCPFDQIRSWWDGKCRPAPRFSLYRVGR